MKHYMKALRIVCVVICVLIIAVPALIAHTTRSNGIGAGMWGITECFGLPLSSLLCGVLSSSDPKKLWILPAVPSALYFLFFPFSTALPYLLTQFFGLVLGYAVFALGIYILKNRKERNRK